jgi:hypothetical protein
MNLGSKLRDRATPIRVGFVGAGIFGSQVIHAAEATPGMETSAIADIDLEKAKTTYRRVDVPDDEVAHVDDAGDLNAAVESGHRAVTGDGAVVVDADLDVIVDATGDPNVAAVNGYRSLMGGKHFVNVSVEADTVCGPVLADVADRNDVTYTLAYGDQPGKIVELCEWAIATGFEIVAAGRAARQPTRHGRPDDALDRHPFVTAFGEDLEPNPVMYNTFMDGTKRPSSRSPRTTRSAWTSTSAGSTGPRSNSAGFSRRSGRPRRGARSARSGSSTRLRRRTVASASSWSRGRIPSNSSTNRVTGPRSPRPTTARTSYSTRRVTSHLKRPGASRARPC